MAEFSSEQLDRLEDLLADLEQHDDLSDLELEEPVRARAEDYQRILRASRQALVLETVPEGLLDAVVAEARAAKSVAGRRPSVWQRWRTTLLPALALAGTTAAVLWIVSPDPAVDSLGDARAPSTTLPGPSGETSVDPAGSITEPRPGPAIAAEPSEPPAAAADLEHAPTPESSPAQASRSGLAAQKQAAPKPAPEPPPDEKLADKDDAWDQLERAEAARKLGDCDSAEPLFRRVLDSALNAKSKAPAQMGLGLCRERRGLDGSRELQDAVANDPSLESVIQRELEASKPNKKPAAKKKSARSPDVQQENAFPGD